jgi:flagellin
MSLSILTNVPALQIQQNLLNSSNSVASSMQKLSSGLQINSAADNPAGYTISQGLTSQVNGLNQATNNVGDATSMVQTAEGSLQGVQGMLQEIRELAVQYNNGSQTTQDLTSIQDEANQLTQEIDRERGASTFNGQNLLNGTAGSASSGTVTYQVGANEGNTLTATFSDIEGTSGMSVGFSWGQAASGGVVFDLSQAGSLSNLDTAINNVSGMASALGSTQDRLQYTSDSIATTQQNIAAANSQITDVNMAAETTNLSQEQVLQQAGTAMLAQAQQQPQLILKLLQNL